MDKLKKIRLIILAAGILTIVFLVIHLMYIHVSNHTEHHTAGLDETAKTYMDVHDRGTSTSSWTKSDYDYYGQTIDIYATTLDAYLYNNARIEVNGWNLRLDITKDCLINQMWNGTVEIHQYVGTSKEKVQSFSLQDYDLEDIELEYLYAGDLLIPLQAGDYLIYYPSEDYKEDVIDAKDSEKRVGIIFYYLDEFELPEYQLNYYYRRSFMQSYTFLPFLVTSTALFILIIVYFTTLWNNRQIQKEIELQKSSINCMSDIYEIIYLIDLEKNELTPIYADEESEKLRPKDMGAREQLNNMFQWDAGDLYKDMMLEFANLDDIGQRLKNKNSIAREYISKEYGWCRIRFFAMDRHEDTSLEKVLFTIQKINDEKEEMESFQNRIEKVESESKAKSVFLANMSHEIRTPINAVLGFNTMILREAKDKKIKEYAREIKSAGNMLLSLINGILDFSKLEAGKMELAPTSYSLSQLIFDVYNITKSRIESKNLEFKFDVSANLPDKLYGDDMRLKQVIINIITNAAKYTDKGQIKLSVYGKSMDNKVHLLVSVKDTGMGIKPEDLDKITERYTRVDEDKNRTVEGTGLGLSLVTGLLELMGSKLEIISSYGEGSEFYFEVEQEIVEDTLIGKLDFEAIGLKEDDRSSVGFRAKDTRILVVDDNPTNLLVISELLDGTDIDVVKAYSGAEALEYTAKEKYDIIFMDHMMPEMDGLECFEHIKTQEGGKNQTTSVVMLTANALQGAREEYESLGFADFMPKPVQLGKLTELIVKLLPEDRVEKIDLNIKKEASEAASKLPEIEGVDVEYALGHVGSDKGVRNIMEQFASLYEADAKELESYYKALSENQTDSEALKSYRIKVHAMKSTANLFGGLWLYGQAASLEKAAREENVTAILDGNPYYLQCWRQMGQKVGELFPKAAGEKKQEDKGELLGLIHQLDTSMKAYDIKSADSLMAEIEKYSLSKEKEEVFNQLKVAVSGLDAEAVSSLCQKLSK